MTKVSSVRLSSLLVESPEKSKRSGASPSLSARELGFHWLWLASPF